MKNYYLKRNITTSLFLIFCTILAFSQTGKMVNTEINSKPGIISVLIVDSFSNHQWDTNTEYLKIILEATNKFQVSVSSCPNQQENNFGWKNWNPNFSKYDVIIQTCNNVFKEDSLQWPEHVKQSFERYVEQRGGVYMYHGATNAIKAWSEYNKMIGLGWGNKDFGVSLSINDKEELEIILEGDGENTGHGKRRNALLTRINDYPIHSGMPKRWRAADIEVYRYSRGDIENLEVLSYAKDLK